MKTNILATADGLSDQDLVARLNVLAGNERVALVELVAHLAASIPARPSTPPRATVPSSVIALRISGCLKTPPATA